MNDQKRNQQAYGEFALHYHKNRSCEEQNLWNLYLDEPIIHDLLGDPPAGTKALDLGCGSGLLTRWLKDTRVDIHGVDFSRGLISIAEEENPNIDFTVLDIGCTPYADATFDVVVSGLVMHYVQDLDPVFAEASRILNVNGLFVFTMHYPFDEVAEVRWSGNGYQATMRPYFHDNQYKWIMLEGMELLSHHHTFENISMSLCRQGFVIERIAESRADDNLQEQYERFHNRTNTYPSFGTDQTCFTNPVIVHC